MTYKDVVLADGPARYHSSISGTHGGTAITIGSDISTDPNGIGGEPGFYFPGTAASGDSNVMFWTNLGLTSSTIQNWSIEYWVKTSNTTSLRLNPCYMYGGSNTYLSNHRIMTDGDAEDGLLRLEHGNMNTGFGVAYSDDPVNDGEWHHIVVTSTSSQVSLYVDGVLHDQVAGTSNKGVSTATRLQWGRQYEERAVDRVFQGSIAHPAYYLKVLTAAQVANHYNAAFVSVTAPAEVATATAMMSEPEVETLTIHNNVDIDGVGEAEGLMIAPSLHVEKDFYKSASGSNGREAIFAPRIAWTPETNLGYVKIVLAMPFTGSSTVNIFATSATGNSGTNIGSVIASLTKPSASSTQTLILNASQLTALNTAIKNGAVALRASFQASSPGYVINVGSGSVYAQSHGSVFFAAPTATAHAVMTSVDMPDAIVYPSAATATAVFKAPIMISHSEFHAGAAEATASMGSAWGGPMEHVTVNAETATATAVMGEGRMAHVNVSPVAAHVTAKMGNAWFRSNRQIFVDALEASGMAVEPADVYVGRNVSISVGVSTATMFARDPEAVNGVEVNNDALDPHFNRVTRRSTEGHLPPPLLVTGTWLRFNERSGGKAWTYNAAGTRVDARDITGLYEQGLSGPNNKSVLRVDNATMGHANEVVTNTLTERTYEFSIKVDPGHSGRMDIAYGRLALSMSGGRTDRLSGRISIENGKVVIERNWKAVGSKRIDDGKWHHIVITKSHDGPLGQGVSTAQQEHDLMIYIDGKLDRRLVGPENVSLSEFKIDIPMTAFFGLGTGFPFRGEISNFIERPGTGSNAFMFPHQVQELHLDMFGYKAVRAGASLATAGATAGNRVESNMKKMLIISWEEPHNTLYDWDGFLRSIDARRYGSAGGPNPRRVDPQDVANQTPQLSPVLGYGYASNMDIGSYQLIYQKIDRVDAGTNDATLSAYGFTRNGTGEPLGSGSRYFRDPNTGLRRLLNLQTDVDLDDFEIITFQNYPNRVYTTQSDRLAYEAFLESVNEALAAGHKIWLNDADLAADLGWVSRVDYVPVMPNRSLDPRSYEVFPFNGQNGDGESPSRGYGPKDDVQPITRPANGSLPQLPTGTPDGAQVGNKNVWNFDLHQNNGYRVVNEIEGLTDLPSWEVVELAARNKTVMFENNLEQPRRAYRLENRSGRDFTWTRSLTRDGEAFNQTKPSKGRGLKAGDQFYDFTWFEYGYDWFRYAGSANASLGVAAERRRSRYTWAIPQGHLRVGTPVSTFRSTVWNDFGSEVPNPYANHIRNAVIRPGDRLPNGKKVAGYAYMDFAEHPVWEELAGVGIAKDLTFGPGQAPMLNYNWLRPGQSENSYISHESEYSFDWDWVSGIGRTAFSGGGLTNVNNRMTISYTRDINGNLLPEVSMNESVNIPMGQKMVQAHPQTAVPHMTWNARGISWLTLVESKDAEFSNTAAGVATATGAMLSPSVSTERDAVITVGSGHATAVMTSPDEAMVKDVKFMPFPAHAEGKMNGLAGGFKASAATAYAEMPSGTSRPLDIEEVLFFTLTMNRDFIYLRMEEN